MHSSAATPTATATVDELEDPLDWELWKGDWPFWKHAVAGSCAGVMEHIALFPLDTIKTNVQAVKVLNAMEVQMPKRDLEGHKSVLSNSTFHPQDTNAASAARNAGPNVKFDEIPQAKTSTGLPYSKYTFYDPKYSILRRFFKFNSLKSCNMRAVVSRVSPLNSSSTVSSAHLATKISRSVYLKSKLPFLSKFRPTPSHKYVERGGRGEILAAINRLIAEGGFLRFFRGVTAITSGCIPAHATYFSVYEAVKYKLNVGTGGKYFPGYAAICGAAAAMSHDLILTPMDLVKQRLQLGCYTGTIDCIQVVLRSEGPFAFLRSMPTTIAMNVPFGAVAVSINELLKHLLNISQYTTHTASHFPPQKAFSVDNAYDKTNLENIISLNEAPDKQAPRPPLSALYLYFICAGAGGGVAGAVSNPFDVIKTRLQTQDCEIQRQNASLTLGNGGSTDVRISPVASKKYRSFVNTTRTIFVEEGIRGFWKGTTARMALSIPATAVSWGTYEFVKYLLHYT